MNDEVLIQAHISSSRWGYYIRVTFEYPPDPLDPGALPPLGLELENRPFAWTLRGALRKADREVRRETRKAIGSGERVVASSYILPEMRVGE